MLLAGATAPEPLPVYDLVEADLWDQLPADLLDLLALLPSADLYLQDEMQVAFHPTRQPGVVSQRSTGAAPGPGSWRQSQGVWLWAGGLARWLVRWPGGERHAPRMCSVNKCVLLRLVQSSADGLPS